MRCIAILPGTNRVDVVDRPEPPLPGEREVLIEMLECGVCGTDRHIIASGQARPAPGEGALILGHEPLGRVLQVGAAVHHLQAGDYVTATNQRSCGHCTPCAAGEVDLCVSAAGTGRGISGMDGFLRPRLLDDAAFCVRVPSLLAPVAVLTEPLAVSEKVIAAMRQVQHRLPHSLWVEQADRPDWAAGLRFAIGGAGPVGALAAFALVCHGAEVHVLDRAPVGGAKARVIAALGAHYHCTEDTDALGVAEAVGPIDAAVEASGSGEMCVSLWRALGRNGVMGVVGGARNSDPPIPVGEVFSRALSRNQALVGSVASNPRHFVLALQDLAAGQARFPAALDGMISERCDFAHADAAFAAGHDDDIKRVIRVSGA